MTSITWKDGGPLMTANGLIGGSPACCCENPPPPVCACPDPCSYFIEITSPSHIAVKSPPSQCPFTSLTSAQTQIVDEAFPAPDGFDFCDLSLPGFGTVKGWAGLAQNLGDEDRHVYAAAGYRAGICSDGTYRGRVGCSIEVELRCSDFGAVEPSLKLYVGVNVEVYLESLDFPPKPTARLLRLLAVTTLPSQCVTGVDRTCVGDIVRTRFAYIQTPSTVTATGRDSGIGEYAVMNDYSVGVETDIAESIADHVLDSFSATFRITSRRSCRSAPCSCTAAAGTEWTFSNGTRSKTFTHGADDVEWGGAPFYWSWDGVGYLVLEIFDPADYVPGIGGLVIERHTVQITCDTVDDVSTWMASVFSQCIQYDNVPQITHETYDEWAGVLECVPGCEDEHRAAGDPVLDGDLVDVEYLGRSTAVGTTECTPPPRISISVKQSATC